MNAFETGSLPEQVTPGQKLQACRVCGKQFGAGRWERWCGFVIRCPLCGAPNGKHWRFKPVLFSGLLFNAISFLFILRPRVAVPLLLLYVLIWAGWAWAMDRELISESATLWVTAAVWLSPVLVNAVVLIRHEKALDEIPLAANTASR